MVLARLICFIPSESIQHLTSAEVEHGFEMPKSHIPIIPFHGSWPSINPGDTRHRDSLELRLAGWCPTF